jgi:RNA polymerase sigma-70 factor, ECF subfamily
LTDNWYIDRVKNGDREAFATLIEKHKSMVYTVAYRIVKNHEDAEELTQDAFLKVFQSIRQFEYRSKFSTWLYRIVYNAAISSIRKKRIESTLLEPAMIENYSDEDVFENLSQLDDDEQKNLVESILNNLNPEEGTLITLFYMDNCSTQEIAEITGLTQSNVKVKLHRIRKQMLSELTRSQKLFEMKKQTNDG